MNGSSLPAVKAGKKNFNFMPYLFIAPHIVIFIIFFAIPMFVGIYASFTRWNIYTSPVWVGLENYRTILFNKGSTFYRQFWSGLGRTILFTVMCVPPQIILPLLFAWLLSTKPKCSGFFRSVFYLPTMFSISSAMLAWLYIFHRQFGLFNRVLGFDIAWLNHQPFLWIALVVTTLWWCLGTNMIIYIAALSRVDSSMIEASELDGASFTQRFWYIILPSIRFPLVYTIVVTVVQQLNIYGQPIMLTTGAKPPESVFVLLIYIRELAFGTGNPIAGMASAMATMLGLLIGVISLVQLRLLRSRDV